MKCTPIHILQKLGGDFNFLQFINVWQKGLGNLPSDNMLPGIIQLDTFNIRKSHCCITKFTAGKIGEKVSMRINAINNILMYWMKLYIAIRFKITVSGLYDLNITYISMRDMHLKTS